MGVQPLAWREIVRRFLNMGYEGPFYGKGKNPHPFMKRDSHKVTIPNDHGETITRDLIRRMLRYSGISEEDWEKAAK